MARKFRPVLPSQNAKVQKLEELARALASDEYAPESDPQWNHWLSYYTASYGDSIPIAVVIRLSPELRIPRIRQHSKIGNLAHVPVAQYLAYRLRQSHDPTRDRPMGRKDDSHLFKARLREIGP